MTDLHKCASFINTELQFGRRPGLASSSLWLDDWASNREFWRSEVRILVYFWTLETKKKDIFFKL